MSETGNNRPSILVPYTGPDPSGDTSDIFLYLRPEANGMQVESVLLGVIRKNSFYSSNLRLVFMANFPGEYIRKKNLVEHHYSYRIKFSSRGKQGFTGKMKSDFEARFGEDFESARITGPYEAMKELGLTAEELFNVWVPESDFHMVYGNSIKKYKGLYILNYDLPAVLQKNSSGTDIAVMLFRVYFSWQNFSEMIGEMESSLREKGLISGTTPAARIFHYTKSPFEQIQDSLEYLIPEDRGKENISFLSFLENRGFTREKVLEHIDNPIVSIETPDGIAENTICEFTRGMNYREAAGFLKSVL